MNNHQQVADNVRRIQADHFLDGDGGYAAVTAIRSYWHRLEPAEQNTLREVLKDFVSRREKDVWSIAWETVVQEQAIEVAPALLEELASSSHDTWSDQIVLGLLRLDYREGSDFYCQYIKSRLVEAGPLLLPLVADLARVSPNRGIEIAIEYLMGATRNKLESRIEPYAVAFVRHYLEVDEHLLARLIRELNRRDPVVGKWFSLVLDASLAKPWIETELGKERRMRLRSEVADAARSDVGGRPQ